VLLTGFVGLNDGLDIGEVRDVADDLGAVGGEGGGELLDGGEGDEGDELEGRGGTVRAGESVEDADRSRGGVEMRRIQLIRTTPLVCTMERLFGEFFWEGFDLF
jgi:hypothetical protein